MKEISSLLLLAKVVELGSFAQAARELNVPTTTVSRKIQQLESELGGKLLNRSTRALSLTELGQQVLPKAQLIADTVFELYSEAEEFSSQPKGTLTITAPHAFSQDILAPMLAEFQRLYPSIMINLSSSNRFQDLTKQNIDFAFRLGPLHDSSMIALTLSPVRYVLVASREYLKQKGIINHPHDLYQHQLLRNHVDGYFLPWRFEHEGEVADIGEANGVICDDFNITQQFVLNHAGIAYLPASLFRHQQERDCVEFILQEWTPQQRSMLLVYQGKQHLPLKSQLFIDFVKEKLEAFSQALK
ncbi:LysR family transcriptional regulator [Vibrio artabrorum]|uniref:LysR family transcriptional regulator n=1 Tax=Vibrio artabrorum TaxID=446374 RepID=UPI00354BD59D